MRKFSPLQAALLVGAMSFPNSSEISLFPKELGKIPQPESSKELTALDKDLIAKAQAKRLRKQSPVLKS